MDRVTKKVRSRMMAAIHSKNTSIERLLFSSLRKKKVYFVKHYKLAAGTPDIALPAKKIAIFIDGDFWHGYRYPSWKKRISSSFWRNKIEKNRSRDRRNFAKLRRRGWRVLRIWEHEIENDFPRAFEKALRLLCRQGASGRRLRKIVEK